MNTYRQRGFTIIEMMIAVALGIVASGAAVWLFAQSKNNYLQDDRLARMQENARYVLHVLAHDIAMTGFFGGPLPTLVVDPGAGTLPITTDCGASGVRWAYDPNQPLQYFIPSNSTDTPNSVFGCISDSDYAVNTNALAIKHISGSPQLAGSALEQYQVYLRTSALSPTLFKAGASETTPANFQDWAYQAHVYYIEVNNGIPELHRKHLGVVSNTPTMRNESGPMAQGIEYFHVQFGIDTTGDGTANRYLSTPPTSINSAVSVRLYVLMRSVEPFYSYTDDKDYVLGDITLCTVQSPNTNSCDITLSGADYFRRVYSTTVQLRNHIYQTQILTSLGS